ncbi:MAG: putative metal-binding motif-containing protein [Sandaracinaceae bacterium]|nr:putative metal-binding motif-containing protein [Sandaracinaceae bacterium]
MSRRTTWGAAGLLLGAMLAGLGCNPPPVVVEPDAARVRRDAATDAANDTGPAVHCSRDDECDDGVFCNGAETCTAGVCAPGTSSCDDGIACTIDGCNVDSDVCTHVAPDMDGDGYGDADCLDRRGVPTGEDCDDTDVHRAPGNVEVCDAANLDEDCNLATRGNRDDDGDGFEDHLCCNPIPVGSLALNCGNDCDDGEDGVRPAAQELCDGVDNNCNAVIDEGCICTPGTTRPCPRAGECAAGVETCVDGRAYSDCSIAPIAETCNGLDDNCNGLIDEMQTVTCYRDFDEDTFPDDGDPVAVCPDPARPSVGSCPRLTTNVAPAPGVTDCCDFDPRAHPGQTSFFSSVNTCGGFDFDCDGVETIGLTAEQSGINCSAASLSEARCTAADMAVGAAPGFWSEEGPPPCGVSSLWLADCRWLIGGVEAPVDTCFPVPSSRIQRCR